MSDILTDMLADLQATRPPIYDFERWQAWLAAVGQTVSAFPTVERRWACVVILANDLCLAMPGLSLALAYNTLAHAVFTYEAVEGKR